MRVHAPYLHHIFAIPALLCVAAMALAQEAHLRELPVLAVALTQQPPTIDGVLDDACWQSAAGTTGLTLLGHDRLSPRATAVSIAYDAQRLYVAYACPHTPGTDPVGVAFERDGGKPWREDSVELFVVPDPEDPKAYYQLIANCAGSVVDLKAGDPKWNGAWSVATSKGDAAWTAEVSILFSELGASVPQPGAEWRGNFCRDVAAEGTANETWADVGPSYVNPSRFGTLRFVGSAPVVRVAGLGRPDFGSLKLSADATNPTQKPQRLVLDAHIMQPGTTLTAKGDDWAEFVHGKLVTTRSEATIPAGTTQAIELEKAYTDKDLGLLVLTAKLGDGSVLYSQHLPIHLQAPLTLSLQPIPVLNKLEVSVACGTLDEEQGKRAEVALVAVSRADGKRVAEQTVTLAGAQAGVSFDYAQWAQGDYDIQGAVVLDGQQRETASAEFQVLPTPEWVGNSLGSARVIVPPYTPMEYQGSAISCWGRTVDFGEGVLPQSFISQAEEMLSGPMRLSAVVDAKELTFTATRPISFGEQSEDRVELRTEAKAGDISVRIDWWMEYDGFIWADMTLSAPIGTAVDNLTLQIPLRGEIAQMVHATTNQRRGGINEFLTGQKLSYPFLPTAWVGNHDRGLNWCAESDEHWNPELSESAIELVPEGDGYVFQANLIQERSEIGEPIHFGFGLLGTPVKPLPKGWSSFTSDKWPPSQSRLNWQELGNKPDCGIIWTNKYGNHLMAPLWTPDVVGDLTKQGREMGVNVIHYIAPGCHSMAYPEPQRYLKEWRIESPEEFYIPDFDETYPRLCENSSFSDYLLWGINDMVLRHGVRGIYHDGGAPGYCKNTIHGCGWRGEDRKVRRTRPIRACREYHKRLATMLYHDHGIENPIIYDHTSDICFLPALTFSTVHLDGEQYKGQKRGKVPYTDILSLQEILPEYVSTQWGVITVFLNICGTEGDEARQDTATFLAYTLPFGVPFYGTYLYQQYNEDINRLYGDFDIDEATFHLPWHAAEGISVDGDPNQTPVACYTYPEQQRLLVVAGNITDTARKARVTLDAAKLGLGRGARIRRNVSHDVEAVQEGSQLSLDMPPYSFALVWVE